MAELLHLPTFADARGSLTVIERELPFTVRRVYFMYACGPAERGGHRHRRTIQGLVCVAGSCTVDWNDGSSKGRTRLETPEQLLLLQPADWHVMHSFTPDAVLLVVASEPYDPNDYVTEGYSE